MCKALYSVYIVLHFCVLHSINIYYISQITTSVLKGFYVIGARISAYLAVLTLTGFFRCVSML